MSVCELPVVLAVENRFAAEVLVGVYNVHLLIDDVIGVETYDVPIGCEVNLDFLAAWADSTYPH